MNEQEAVVPEEVKPVTIKAGTTIGPRAFITKSGKIRADRLSPIIYHDNRNGGAYDYGKNAEKRAKKSLKSK
jgi:hypothetical protein